jgi:hypothetical protein
MFLVPKHDRKLLGLRNEVNGSTIDGESTNPDLGRGDRRTSMLIDEFLLLTD